MIARGSQKPLLPKQRDPHGDHAGGEPDTCRLFFFFSTLIEGTEMGCYSEPWSPGMVWPHMVEAAPHNAGITYRTESALWSSDNHVLTAPCPLKQQ